MTTNFQWTHSAEFYERVERLNLHGLHFQHVMLCRRRAWMYLHGINFAQWYSRVALGTAKHLASYQRDRSTTGLLGLAPDRIDWQQYIVHENKGSGGAVEAANLQSAFYALMLSIATGRTWKVMIHILSSRTKRTLELDHAMLTSLLKASEELEQLADSAAVPPACRKKLCTACSLALFCGFG